jgi:alpha-ketoglutarate-dependent taurine dioxygenase
MRAMLRLSFDTPHDDVRTALDRDGAVYLTGVGTEPRLLELAERLGEVIAPGTWVGSAASLHDGRIYSVEVREGGAGLADQHGNTVVSSTNRAFALHTDGYSRPEPPRYVLLMRADDGPDDTVSYVSDAHRALRDLDAGACAHLARPEFPSSAGPFTVVERLDDGVRLRFNKTEIDRWAEPDSSDSLDHELREAAALLDTALHAHQRSLTIAPSDCLLLDNWRACHGRSAMPADSRRVLKRVWVA